MAFKDNPDKVTAGLNRFEAVRDWFVSVGACEVCSTGMAIALVQKESGNRGFVLPSSYGCAKTSECRQRVKLNWNKRPE